MRNGCWAFGRDLIYSKILATKGTATCSGEVEPKLSSSNVSVTVDLQQKETGDGDNSQSGAVGAM